MGGGDRQHGTRLYIYIYIYIQKCWLLAGDVCFFFCCGRCRCCFAGGGGSSRAACLGGRVQRLPPEPPSSFEIFDMKLYDTLWFCFCCCFFLFVTLFVVCSCWWFAIDCYIVCYVIRDNVCDIILYFDIFWYPLWYFFSFATRFLTWCCF